MVWKRREGVTRFHGRGPSLSFRTKITLLVLAFGLSEAILLGVIGYNSVSVVSSNAAEMRRISQAIEGVRSLSVSLSQISSPADLLMQDDTTSARELFVGEMSNMEHKVKTCAATSCHGYDKRPPEMAQKVLRDLVGIRQAGVHVLSGRLPGASPPLAEWSKAVDSPSKRVFQATSDMSDELMKKAKELETSSRETERSALYLVAIAALVCILAAIALCHPIALAFTRPLERLALQSRRIARGNLNVRAEEDGPQEVVFLAQSFNLMLTDLDRNRKELLAHQEHLEQTVADRLRELQRKDEQLRRVERLAGIGLVAGTVAHDLNNPLSNLILNAEVLQNALPEGDPSRKIADDIRMSSLRCRQIAMDIRVLGREGEIVQDSCNLVELVQEAIDLLRSKWEPRKINVRCDGGEAPVGCLCSSTHMVQVLVNLIENAVHASAEGGAVDVRLRETERGVTIEVEDHGAGIPSLQRDSVGKLFFTTKPDGTGLGVAICKRIVERHGGAFEIETRTAEDSPGRETGTLVRIILPLAKEKGIA